LSLLPLFQWLGRTPLGVTMRDSTYGFAIVEMVHLLALAFLGGAILLVDLRLLGFGLRSRTAGQLAKDLSPLLLVSLALMVISGVLLVASETMKCYYHPAFRVKMLLFVIAITFYFTLHRRLLRSELGSRTTGWAKAAAVISLALWLGVGLAGRVIGFL